MHRGKGNLTGIEKRRALNPAIVGGLKKSAENSKKDTVHPDMLSSGEEVGLERLMVLWIENWFKIHNLDEFDSIF